MNGKRVTVAGLGHFGGNVATARWLVDQGAHVLVTDIAPAEKLQPQRQQLADLPIEYHLGEHRETDFTSADLVVASPAIPPASLHLTAARAAGVPVTTEICLFAERCPARIIGVTGTKGKSTTASLLHRMLATRFKTWIGGNLGGSLLADLPRMTADDLVVLELSSFMLHYLDQIPFVPHIALMTMLAADHIEWHGSLENYLAAKAALTRQQTVHDFLVLDVHSPSSRRMADASLAQVVWYGQVDDPTFSLRIPGQHNQRNAQGAFAAARLLGIPFYEAQKAIANFPGLKHRLQWVHEHKGIRFYDDSIATIPEAAIAALKAFEPKRVIQIVGGSDHGLPIDEMCATLRSQAKAVLCIGQTASAISDRIGGIAHRCHDLQTAMLRAREIAEAGDVVLLSTGYKSFDQFSNYEDRGDAFAKLAREVFV